MKTLSLQLLSETVVSRRKALKMTQVQLSRAAGIHRSVLSNLETGIYTPSIDQLQALASVLHFEPTDMFVEQENAQLSVDRRYKIAVAGTGYVGLSLAVLLAQHNDVTTVDIIPEKVEKLKHFISPIQDTYIEKYLQEAKTGKRRLSLTATTDGTMAYTDADYIIIAVPTNYDPKTNYFDCSAVEAVIRLILTAGREKKPVIVIKSTVPVGYTAHIREMFQADNIIFSPEFLRESKALYDSLYPSRIIVGCDENSENAARTFAALSV